MATNEPEQGAAQPPHQHGDEMEESLREAAESGQGKGVGVTPGHAGQAHVDDRPADAGQVPPV